jgi:prepilin-type N-terminal cleavage/methylation domain-containing protein
MGRADEQAGFSLVELMVVVLILAALVAIAIPIFNAPRALVEEKACFANQRTIDGALQSYQAATGAFPPAIDAGGTAGDACPLVTAGYIRSWPVCPLASGVSTATYAYGYDSSGHVVLPTGGLNCSATHGSYY